MDTLGLGKRLKSMRKHRGYTLQALEEKLGYSRGIISRYEQNISVPSFLEIREMAETLHIKKEWLAYGVGPKSSWYPASD